jgi:SanA protein
VRLLLLAASQLVVPAVANAVVLLGARGEAAASVAAVPHAQAALVLGAQVKPDGTPSATLADRIAAAAEL